jgi:nicotinate-nucleotide adenylyltransferase
MKIGVYCGSFNPIHNGHINVAKWILEKEKLDKIIWVPLYKPFHKSLEELEAPEYRLEMVKLAVKDNKQFEVFDKEIISKEVRDTLDIIEDINNEYGVNELYTIIGGDAAESFHLWQNHSKILEISNVIVYSRRGHSVDLLPKMKLLKAPYLDVSATEIRNKLENKYSIEQLIPREVYNYIIEKNLYK